MTAMSSIDRATLRKEVADFDAALAVLAELERRGEGGAGLALGAPGCRRAAAWPAYFVEHRLGIERIDVRRPAVHEQVDDVLGLGREMRRRWRAERVPADGGLLRRNEQVAERQRAKAHAAARPIARGA